MGWRSFNGSANTPDYAIVDNSNLVAILPVIIERPDNHNVYLLGNRDTNSGTKTLVFNKATFDGSNWSWGTWNLTYESNAARGVEDTPSANWDPVRSLVVVAYDIGGTTQYGVFTLDAFDHKAYLNTPSLLITNGDWGSIAVDQVTGDYYLFLINAAGDAKPGPLGFTKSVSGIGPWNTTLTPLDSDPNNRGISLRKVGTRNPLDILYANEPPSATASTIRFASLPSTPAPLTVDFSFNPPSPSPSQSLTFNTTILGGTPPYTFTWNFGDGTSGSGGITSHAYLQAGGYNVSLIARDNSTKMATAQHFVAIGTFSFTADGDLGFTSNTFANWKSMAKSGASFALALGDLVYNVTRTSEQTWCKEFKGNITNVEIVAGNHDTYESNVTGGGSINKFIEYCPFTLGTATGTYGFQYYFDYPSSNPVARFIMTDPDIWLGNSSSTAVSYGTGTQAQAWVNSTIDDGRARGIPWVIVGMHKPCLTTGTQGCEIRQDFMRFLINKRVDLVLSGHDHNYQRSKQLACATDGTYVSSCVVNNGYTGSYSKGAGTLFAIVGTGGDSRYKINVTLADYQYFAVTNDTSYGYMKITVSSTSIVAQFVGVTGKFSDTWSILVHDVAVSSMAVSRYFAYVGIPSALPIKVNVTVANQGSGSETTLTVSAKANSTVIGTQTVTNLAASSSLVVTFSWNTTLAVRGNYTLSGNVTLVGDSNLSNNAMSLATLFQARKAGDVLPAWPLAPDNAVDITDLIAVYLHQFTISKPNVYDINNDGAVDITDLILTYLHQFT